MKSGQKKFLYTTGKSNVIQIPVADTKEEVINVELTGDIVKKFEENTFDISVKIDTIEYIIPAEEFTISKVAKNLEIEDTDIEDILIKATNSHFSKALIMYTPVW